MTDNEISFDNLLVRHLIRFDYDLGDFYIKESVHYLYTIENSIHYKCLVSGDYSNYNNLITTTNQSEHSLNKFLKLKEKFNIDFLTDNKIIVVWHESYDKYTVIDGTHRLAIMKYNNTTKLNPNWFHIIQQ